MNYPIPRLLTVRIKQALGLIPSMDGTEVKLYVWSVYGWLD